MNDPHIPILIGALMLLAAMALWDVYKEIKLAKAKARGE